MRGKNILFCILFVAITLGIFAEFVLYELHLFYGTIFYVVSSISILIWIMFPIIFYIEYRRLKGKVEEAQAKFIDEMTPKKPLRFCPSDEQLLEIFTESLTEKQHENQDESQKVSEDEYVENKINAVDEEEMMM